MWLHSSRRLLTTHRALIPGAAAGYAVIVGFLIYGLAVHARLETWREPRMQAAATRTPAPAAHAVAACADFAGMGQTPCNAKADAGAAYPGFRPLFAARETRDVQPPAEQISLAPHRFAALEPRDIQPPAEQATPAPHPPARILIAAAEFPEREEEEDEPLDQDEPPHLSIAYRE